MSVPIEIQIKGDREVQSKIKSLNKELTGLGKSSTSAARPMEQTGKAVQEVGKTSQKTTLQVRTMGQRVQQAGAGMTLAGSAAIGLWNAYDNVTDSAQKVEIAQGRLTGAENRLSKAREALTKLTQSGTASALDLEQAQRQVTAAEAGVERANLQLTNSQEALNESYLNAATNIIPQIFTGMTGLTQVYDSFKNNTDEVAASIFEQAAAMDNSGISIENLGGGILEVTESTTELGSATAQTGSAMADIGATATDVGTDFTQMGSSAGVAATNMAEVGTAAAQTATSVGDLHNTAVDVGTDMTQIASNTGVAASNLAGVGTAAIGAAGGVGTLKTATDTLGKSAGMILLMKFATIGAAIGGAAGHFYSAAKSLEALANPMSTLSQWTQAFIDALGALFNAIPGAKQLFEALGVAVTFYSQTLIELISRLPVVGGLFKSQEGLASTLADKLGILGNKAEEQQEQQEELAASIQKTDDALSNLSPLIQQTAQAWGLYGLETQNLTTQQQAQIQGLQELESRYQTAKKGVIDLAVANGQDLKDALAMTDHQVLEFLLTMEKLGPTAESQADQIQKASQKFADAWLNSFEKIKAGQEEFGNTMSSAIEKMAQEAGHEMEVGLSDLEKKVSHGIQGFSKQFAEEIFPEDFLAAAILENNDPQDIVEELHDLWDDVVEEGIITPVQASEMFKPLTEFIGKKLPKDTDQAFGYLIGRMPHLMAQIEPVIVNGIRVAGGSARAALNSMLVQPFLADLQALETGMSGVDIGRGLLTKVQALLPELRAQFPQIAGLMQQTLENTALTADQKVQEIIGYLGQISPEFEEQIMQMDKDADGIADIMDNKILGPVEMMKLGMLEAFEAIFRAMGKTDWADALVREINELTGAHKRLSGEIDWTTGQMKGYTKAEVAALPTMNQVIAARNRAAEATRQHAAALEAVQQAMVHLPKESEDPFITDIDKRLDAQADDRPGPTTTKKPNTVPPPDTNPFKKALNDLSAFVADWRTHIENVLGGFTFGGFGQKILELAQFFKGALDGASEYISGWRTHIENFLGQFNFGALGQKFLELAKFLKSALDGASEYIGQWRTHIEGFLGKFNFGALGQRFAEIINIAKTYLGGASKHIGEWRAHIENFLAKFNFSGLESAFNKVWSYMKKGLDTASTNIGNWMLSIQNRFNTFLDNLKRRGEGVDPNKEFGEGGLAGEALGMSRFRDSPRLHNVKQSVPGAGQAQMPWLKNDMGGGGLAMGLPDNTANIFKPLIDALTTLKTQFGFSPVSGGGGGGGGSILDSIIVGLQAMRGQFTALAAQATTAITGMAVLWAGHSTMVNGVIQLIGLNIAKLAGAYWLLLTGVQQSITQMAVGWAGHVGAVTGIMTTIAQNISLLAGAYYLLSVGVHQALEQSNQHWAAHISHVGGQISSVGQNISLLAGAYFMLSQGIHQALEQSNQHWGAHSSHVSGQINSIGQMISKLAGAYHLLSQGIHRALEAGNKSWAAHNNHVRGMVSSATTSVRNLANAVQNNMRNIVNSMNNASDAAKNLQKAISNLKNKNITVTTTYKTVGSKSGSGVRKARGFSGVVDQPTRLFVGEANKPELVTVTPLSKSGGVVSMNSAASSMVAGQQLNHQFQQPTIRAGGSTGNITGSKTAPVSEFSGVIPELKAFKQIFADTIEDWVDDFGYELNRFERGFQGVGNILFEIAGGKHFNRITAQQAMNFSRERGYTLRALLSRKSGSNLTMRMDQGDIPGGATGGGGPGGGQLQIFAGADAMHALKYITNAPNLNKPIHSIHFLPGGTGKIFYQDGSMDWIKHAHPGTMGGPGGLGGVLTKDETEKWFKKRGYEINKFNQLSREELKLELAGGKHFDQPTPDEAAEFFNKYNWGIQRLGYRNKGSKLLFDLLMGKGYKITSSSGKYVKAAHGFSGIVDQPTKFLAGERGKEMVNIQPLTQGIRAGVKGMMGGGRPVVIQLHITSELDGRVISETIRKELLGGIYSMS